jgi:hypothetical protein
MKRFLVAIAAVMGLAMMTGADIAYARSGGGGSHGGGGHSSGGSHGGGWHGGGHHGGYYYGGWYGAAYLGAVGFWGWPYYYGAYPYSAGYPYYGYAYDPNPYAVYESAPVSYAEPAAQAAPPAIWYYCTEPAGYYPYVQKCNVLWTPVAPPSSTASGRPEVRMQ